MASGFDAETTLGLEEAAAVLVFGAAGCFTAMLRAAKGLSSSLSDIVDELRYTGQNRSLCGTALAKVRMSRFKPESNDVALAIAWSLCLV